MLKRIAIIAGVLISVVIVGVAAFVWYAGHGGGRGLKDWIGLQLQAIANGYLNPKLTFTDLDYAYPGTVKLRNFKLTADDPANPGKSIDIISCEDAELTLAEIPSVGKPIIIERIVLNKPQFQAIAIAPNAKDFVGFYNLIRQTRAAPLPAPQAGAPTASSEPAPRPKLSEVFKIRIVELIDGKVIYDPRIAGTDPMELDQITTRLDIAPDAAGAYTVATKLTREPVFSLSIAGKLNLDTFNATDILVQLGADLGQEKLSYLPPQIQQLIKQHEIRGALSAKLTGNIPVMEPLKGRLYADLKLDRANVTLGEYCIPIDQLGISARFEDGKIILSMLHMDALKGELEASGSVVLNEVMDSALLLTVKNMILEDSLKKGSSGPPKYAGRLNADIQIRAPINVVVAKVSKTGDLANQALEENWGSAEITLDEARLFRTPILSPLLATMDESSKKAAGKKNEAPKDKVKLVATFTGDQVRLTELKYIGDVVAARGSGSVFLDQRLDMLMNGGPIEKMQSMLGDQIGGAIGTITDQAIAYRITGNMSDPKVNVVVGGGVGETIGEGAGAAGRTAGEAAKTVGDILKGIFGGK